MKILITKVNDGNFDGVVLGSYTPKKVVKIDLFVGCYYMFPDDYTNEEIDKIWNSILGTVIEIPDDCFQSDDGIYLPSERFFQTI